jgi:hypothetical protein
MTEKPIGIALLQQPGLLDLGNDHARAFDDEVTTRNDEYLLG